MSLKDKKEIVPTELLFILIYCYFTPYIRAGSAVW